MLTSKRCGSCLEVYLSGEIDHCAACNLRGQIEALIKPVGVKTLHFHFDDVSFLDSSGIGMLIGRYKTMKEKGGAVRASGLSEPIERLYKMAGLHRIMPITDCGGEHERA